jgi:hypothetical protein
MLLTALSPMSFSPPPPTGVHLVDHLVATWSPAEQLGRWESWEGKGAFLYHLDLAADVAIHLMTLAHYMHVWFLHGLSFHVSAGARQVEGLTAAAGCSDGLL